MRRYPEVKIGGNTSTLLAAFLSLYAFAASEACSEEPSSPERDRYLLLDSRVTVDTRNAKLVLGQVTKDPRNPLFEEDKPWEKRFDNLYANVTYDGEEGIYKCWYSPFIVDKSAKHMSLEQRKETRYNPPDDREMAICYATSVDGIAWTKPELGIVEYEGSSATNILWRGGSSGGEHWEGPHGSGIFKDDRDPDPNRRYKAILKSKILSVAFSADGIRWGPAVALPEADSAGDTHNNAFWAPTRGEYVGITREWGERFGRQVARTSSADFITWRKSEVVLEGLNKNQQTYAMPSFYYGGVYLGLLAIHDQDADRVWTELTWSPDTITWNRLLPGTPFIPNSETEGNYDWGCVFAAAYPIFLEDEIRIYYGASDGYHFGWRNGFFCLATLRPDGFAGYTQVSRDDPAEITTSPIVLRDGVLRITADIEHGGYVTVAALDEQQRVLAESNPLVADSTDVEVKWREGSSLDGIGESQVSLQFQFINATLYSFRVGSKNSAEL